MGEKILINYTIYSKYYFFIFVYIYIYIYKLIKKWTGLKVYFQEHQKIKRLK